MLRNVSLTLVDLRNQLKATKQVWLFNPALFLVDEGLAVALVKKLLGSALMFLPATR